MNNNKNTIKRIIGGAAVCSALLLSGIGLINVTKPKYEIYATGADKISESIANSNFNSNTSSSYPFKPDSFTASNSSSSNDANVNAGVINLSNEDYENRFPNAKRSILDDYVLMIDSTKDKDGSVEMHSIEYGYTTNSAIKMDSNSKYMVSVDVFTATNSNIASLRLYDTENQVNGKDTLYTSIDNINSYNDWTTCTFLIETSNMKGLNLKLGLYLNGAGTVLFDNISCYKLSDNEYAYEKAHSTIFVEKTAVDNVINTLHVKNNAFNDGINNYSVTGVDYDSHSFSYIKDSDGKNTDAIFIKNNDKSYAQYETDDILTLDPNRIYKVDINVKTKNLDGTASLQLVRTDIDENDDKYDATNHNKTISITSNTYSSTESSVTNDYKTYSFVIRSHSSKSVTYKLRFGLGDSENLTSGEMYLSEIELSKIDYSTFNATSSGNGYEKIDFVKAYSNNANMLDNADFNAFEIEDYSSPIPAKAIDWQVETGEHFQKYGVVNTGTFLEDLNVLGLSNLSNPGSPNSTDYNNVLMMYNETADTLSYKSNTKTLKANAYNKFEISVQAQNAPVTLSLVTKKDDSEVVLLSKTINTSGASAENFTWTNIEMFIHNGQQEIDVYLKITLNTSGYGYAFIDDAKFNWLSNPEMPATSSQNEKIKAEYDSASIKVDLSDILLSSSDSNFEKASFFSFDSLPGGVQTGTITLNSDELYDVISSPDVEDGVESNMDKFNSLAKSDLNKKVLSIWSTNYVNFKTTSTLGFTLEQGSDNASAKFYKVSVDVFTQNLDSENEEFGAGIKLTGFDNAFTNIESNNEWTTYTFFIKPKSTTTTYIELSLGNEDSLAKGAVFFGNISVDPSITKAEYEAVTETNLVKVITEDTSTGDDDEDTTTKEEASNSTSNTSWMLYISGIVTALAIIIAVVGILIRKIKWRNPIKRKTKNQYDRNKTVSVQYYSRKATTMREEKIRTLTEDLNKINEERKIFEDNYKHDLTKLREMKIKRANNNDIAKLEKAIKSNQRTASSLGVTANRIAEELAYVKTDAYLNALIKKLSKEPNSENNESEQ